KSMRQKYGLFADSVTAPRKIAHGSSTGHTTADAAMSPVDRHGFTLGTAYGSKKDLALKLGPSSQSTAHNARDLCLVGGGLFCLGLIRSGVCSGVVSVFFTEVLLNVDGVAFIVLRFNAADSSCKCLATTNVGEQVADLTAGGNLLDELVRVHAVGLSGEQYVVAQLLLGYLWLFNIVLGVEEEVGANGLFCRLARFLIEFFTGGALCLEQAGQRSVVVCHLAQGLVQLSVNLLIDNRLWKREENLCQSSLEHFVANSNSLVVLLGLFQASLGVFAQLLDGVELRRHLCKFIVELRKLALLGLLDVNLDGGFLVLVLTGFDGGGELVVLFALHAAQSGIK